ncbi:MAG: phosphoenolpyruvate--protein phosphotransferase [Bacillota bacterium]
MVSLKGVPISPGYAEGTTIIHGVQRNIPIPHYHIAPAAVIDEVQRFESAVQRASLELAHVRDRVLWEFGEAQSEIFATHLALLNDPYFLTKVKHRITRDLVNAEQAIEVELNAAAGKLLAAKDEYFQERAQDIRDIGHRLLRQLIPGTAGLLTNLPGHSVIVAHELLPSDTLDLDRRHVVAIVTERGGTTSHAAILAKSLGVPAVTNVLGALARIKPGSRVLVDGLLGQIIADPSPTQASQFWSQKQQYESSTAAAIAAEQQECITMDGVRIHVYANIGRSHEALEVPQHHLDGVGLFRTEFLFMDEKQPPSLERQVQIYSDVAQAMSGRPLVIRTLDVGGDKIPAFLAAQCESDLGTCPRGLRFSLLVARDLFLTQLQAITRASARHNCIRVLFPMVVSANELSQAIDLLRMAAGASPTPSIGAMIETPAALFDLDRILGLADYLSIGTNDLTQFLLASGRDAIDLFNETTVLHPAVLRAVAQVVEAAKRWNKPVAVCGEAAGDPATACLLVGLGVRELSMSPVRTTRVRYALRRSQVAELRQLAQEALQAVSPAKVRQLLAGLNAAEA